MQAETVIATTLTLAFATTAGPEATAQGLADRAAELDAVVAPYLADGGPGGVVLVAEGDAVVLRRAYGLADVELDVPMRPDHVLGAGSITKQFTAVAILRLVAGGEVALDDDVREFVPDMDTGGEALTIDQVLSNTSGLPNLVDRPDFEELLRRHHTVDELLALTRGTPLHFPPGEGFAYSDTGYILLGAIVERVTGLSYAEFVEQKLCRPLGMADTWYGDETRVIPGRASGYSAADGRVVHAPYFSTTVPHAAGAIFTTVDDLLRWNRTLLAGEVVPPELLERAWSARILPDGTRSGYGFGWKLCHLAGHATREHGGWVPGFSANAIHVPEKDLTVIVLLNKDDDDPDAGTLARRLVRFVLTGEAGPGLHELTAAERAALVGRYRLSPRWVLEIAERDGALVALEGERTEPLVALGPTRLAHARDDGSFLFGFELGADGRAASIRRTLRCEPVDHGPRIDER